MASDDGPGRSRTERGAGPCTALAEAVRIRPIGRIRPIRQILLSSPIQRERPHSPLRT